MIGRGGVMVSYRAGAAADHPLIVALMTELVTELDPPGGAQAIISQLDRDIDLALQTDNCQFFLAHANGEVAGMARADILTEDPIFRLRPDNRCGYIDQMYVRTPFRKTGIGRELLGQCEQWFREQGIGHCLLHASLPAVGFYAKNEYKPNRQMFKKL